MEYRYLRKGEMLRKDDEYEPIYHSGFFKKFTGWKCAAFVRSKRNESQVENLPRVRRQLRVKKKENSNEE